MIYLMILIAALVTAKGCDREEPKPKPDKIIVDPERSEPPPAPTPKDYPMGKFARVLAGDNLQWCKGSMLVGWSHSDNGKTLTDVPNLEYLAKSTRGTQVAVIPYDRNTKECRLGDKLFEADNKSFCEKQVSLAKFKSTCTGNTCWKFYGDPYNYDASTDGFGAFIKGRHEPALGEYWARRDGDRFVLCLINER